MATENNIASQLNDLLVTQDFHPEMLDKHGQPADADDAKIFSFDYVSKSGKNYGTMVIVLGNDNEMQVMYGDNLGRTMEGGDKDDFFDFTQQLHKFATRNFWSYTPQDLRKLRHVQAGIAAIQEGLFEGYYGNRRVSYSGNPTEARLMIKHNQTLGENDARFRHVESIFIETADQERFKLPFTNLAGARAMLEHVKQGGKPYDIRGNHICEMVTELKVLNRFNRASKGRVSEGVTKELVEGAQAYYKTLRESLKHLGTSRGYNNYFESWTPLEVTEQDNLVEDIKTLFVEQTIDTRIEAALPLLARIQQGNAMKEAQIFESWINNLVEGTWSLPDTPEQQEKLKELMSQPLIAGAEGIDATEQLRDVVGDDVLFDRVVELAQENPDANIWDDEGVQRRLEELGIYVVNPSEGEEVAPVADTQDTGVPDGGQIAPAAPVPPVQEDISALEESLRSMLKHAGVPVSEGRMLDESGETLQHILDRFKNEVKRFEAGEELDNDLYDALFDYYASSGEMPYGTMKARTGDPFEWITDRLDSELGTGNHALRLPEVDSVNAFEVMSGFDAPTVESTCNHTTEGEYCPEHGLSECGTTAGGMAPVMGEDFGATAGLAAGAALGGAISTAKKRYDDMKSNEQPGPDVGRYIGQKRELPRTAWQRTRAAVGLPSKNDPNVTAEGEMEEGVVDWAKQKYNQARFNSTTAKIGAAKTPQERDALTAKARQFGQAANAAQVRRTGDIRDNPNFGGTFADAQKINAMEEGEQAFVNKNHDDAINYNGAITGSYYEAKDDPLARIKSLALPKT